MSAAADVEAVAVSAPAPSPAPSPAAAAAAETGFSVICCNRHVHPHNVSLSSFLRGSHCLVRILSDSCHCPNGLKQELRYHRISSQSLSESFPLEPFWPPDQSTENFPFLQNNSYRQEIGGIVHKRHVGEFLFDICLRQISAF